MTYLDWDTRKKAADQLVAVMQHTFPEKAIMAWDFYDAPEQLQALSGHGGDEDHLALLPPGVDIPNWAWSGGPFGCCEVSEHELSNGWRVLIGAHA